MLKDGHSSSRDNTTINKVEPNLYVKCNSHRPYASVAAEKKLYLASEY